MQQAVHSREFTVIVLIRAPAEDSVEPAARCELPTFCDAYAPNELPQPQVCFAFGLLNTKPLVSSAVS